MSLNRYDHKTDTNQPQIVKELLKAGYSVETGLHDIVVGHNNITLWVEVKTPDCYSKKTGLLKESSKTPSQKRLDATYTGARIYAKCSDDIFDWFNVKLWG